MLRLRPRRRSATVALVGVTVLTLLAGAGCGASRAPEVRGAATQFYRAVSDSDGAAVCALLAPRTVAELERSAQASCEDAVLDLDILARDQVSDGQVSGTQVWSDQAQVRIGSDTVFLAEFADGWKVVAAGCTLRRTSQPYDCQLKGA